MDKKLRTKLNALVVAQNAVTKMLEDLYPVGSTAHVFLMSSQQEPSSGIVIGHEGGEFGRVIVRLNSRTGCVRRVSAEDIV